MREGVRRAIGPMVLAVVLAANQLIAAPRCPYADSTWRTLKQTQKRDLLASPHVADLEGYCFCALLGRSAEQQRSDPRARPALDLLMEYAGAAERFELPVLFAALRVCRPLVDESAWKSVCALWEQSNGAMRARTDSLIAVGDLAQADTLFAAFNAAGRLSVPEVLAWANLKQTLRDYAGLARALCGLSRLGDRLTPVGRSQLVALLREAEPEQVKAALAAYRECALGLPGGDTLQLAEWLARSYAQYGLYEEEVATWTGFESPARPALEPLLRVAQRQFSLKRYRYAALAARQAWIRAQNAQVRSWCAAILCESYGQLGPRDSAAVWLGRTDLGTARDAARAVVFYQQGGMLARADSLLAGVPAGPARDTLVLRQLLLAGRADSAAALARRLAAGAAWRGLRQSAALWQLRAALFSGDLTLVRQLADSLQFEPSWEYASEVLGYRYRLERLSGDPEALKEWPAFEYALYRGAPQTAAAPLRFPSYAPRSVQLLSVRLVKAFLERGDLTEAAAAAARVDARIADPEHSYYCAEVLLAQGQPAQARALLEQLILTHPRDIYSSKARLLLLRTQS
jgi:hypothetical protein